MSYILVLTGVGVCMHKPNLIGKAVHVVFAWPMN